MKLKLPLALLAAVLACVNAVTYAATVSNPSDGGTTSNGDYYYIGQDVVWTQSYNYDKSGPATMLSVGWKDGAGSLSASGEKTLIGVANNLYIAGPGAGNTSADGVNAGKVTVSGGATLEVGASAEMKSASGAQLHVGAAANGGDAAKGTLTVTGKGSTAITNYALAVGASPGAKGELILDDGGQMIVRLADRFQDATNSNFFVGYWDGSEGVVTVQNGASLIQTGSGSLGAASFIGYKGEGVLNVVNGGLVDLSNSGNGVTVLGSEKGSTGVASVDGAGSSLKLGSVQVGNAGMGSLTATNGGGLTVLGNMQIGSNTNGGMGFVTLDSTAKADIKGGILLEQGSLDMGGQSLSNVLEVNGTGEVKGASSYQGQLRVNDGASLSGEAINLAQDALLYGGSVANNLTGTAGVLVDSGTSTVVLSGTNTYAGLTNIKQGTLQLDGTVSGDILVAKNATLVTSASGMTLGSGQVMELEGAVVGHVTTKADSELVFCEGSEFFTPVPTDPNTSVVPSELTVGGGTLTFTGLQTTGAWAMLGYLSATDASTTTNVVIENLTNISTGSYTLLEFDNTGNKNAAQTGNFTLSNAIVGGADSRVQMSLTVDTTTLTLNVTGALADLTWNVANGTWTSGGIGEENWLNSSQSPDKFYQGDKVTFKGGTATIVGNVTPGSLAVTGTEDTTFQGSGSITGSTALVKDGTGTLTINNSNAYTGGTQVSEGTLAVGNANALGTGDVTLSNTATLDLNGNAVANGVAVQGTNTINGGKNFAGNLAVNAGAVVSGEAINLAEGKAAYLNGGTVNNSLTGAGQVVQNSGSSTLAGSNSYSGGTLVQSGTLTAGDDKALGSGDVELAGGALDLGGHAIANDISVTGVNTPNLTGNENSEVTLDGAQNYEGQLTVDLMTSPNQSIALKLTGEDINLAQELILKQGEVANNLTGSAGVVKSGEGSATLSGANTYLGNTVVESGTLVAGSNTAFGDATSNIVLQGGTVDLGGNAIANDVIAAGSATLKNAGAHTGDITVTSTATLTHDALALGSGQTLTLEAGAKTVGDVSSSGGLITLGGGNTISGNLTLAGGTLKFADLANTSTVTHLSTTSGTKTLIDVGSLTSLEQGKEYKLMDGSFALGDDDYTILGNPANPEKVREAVTLNVKDGSLYLEVTDGAAAQLTWKVDGRTWKVGQHTDDSASQWDVVDTKVKPYFYNGDYVTFNGGTANIDGEVRPGSIKVTGDANTTFAGTGYIAGGTVLTKDGSGTLTISNANTFTGGTILRDGTIDVQNAAALGTGKIAVSGGMLTGVDLDLTQDLELNAGTVENNLSGTGGVVKSKDGEANLEGNNSYTGDTVVSAGELVLGSDTALGSSQVKLNNATMDMNGFAVGNAVTTSGNAVLLGTSGYTGDLTVADKSTLELESATQGNISVGTGASLVTDPTTPLTIASGKALTLADQASVQGSVTTAAGTTFSMGSGSSVSDTLTLAGGTLSLTQAGTQSVGTLSITDTTSVNIGNFADYGKTGTYTLLTFGTLDSASDLNKLELANTATTSGSVRNDIYLGLTENSLTLTVSADAITLTWIDGNRNWTVGDKTQKWIPDVDGAADWFYDGDHVIFAGTNSTADVVTINGVVKPGSIVVKGSGDTTFSGSGQIIGETTLTKSGTGTLTIESGHSFTGDVTLEGGTVAIGHKNALGYGTITMMEGSVLRGTTTTPDTHNELELADGKDLIFMGGTVEDNLWLSGKGGVVKSTSSTATLKGNHTYEGHTLVQEGTLVLENGYIESKEIIVSSGATFDVSHEGVFTGTVSVETGGTLKGGGENVEDGGDINITMGTVEVGVAKQDSKPSDGESTAPEKTEIKGNLVMKPSDTLPADRHVEMKVHEGSKVESTGSVTLSDNTSVQVAEKATYTVDKEITLTGTSDTSTAKPTIDVTEGAMLVVKGEISSLGNATITVAVGATVIFEKTVEVKHDDIDTTTGQLKDFAFVIQLGSHVQVGTLDFSSLFTQTRNNRMARSKARAALSDEQKAQLEVLRGQSKLETTTDNFDKIVQNEEILANGDIYKVIDDLVLGLTGFSLADDNVSGLAKILGDEDSVNTMLQSENYRGLEIFGELKGTSSVNLGYKPIVEDLVWNWDNTANAGAYDNVWTVQGGETWFDGTLDRDAMTATAGTTAETFYHADAVAFVLNAATQKDVTIEGVVKPRYVIVTGDGSLELNGAADADGVMGSIGGAGGILKDGEGKLSINTSNTFTGDSYLTNGDVYLGADDALGTTGTVYISGDTYLNANNEDVDNEVEVSGTEVTMEKVNSLSNISLTQGSVLNLKDDCLVLTSGETLTVKRPEGATPGVGATVNGNVTLSGGTLNLQDVLTFTGTTQLVTDGADTVVDISSLGLDLGQNLQLITFTNLVDEKTGDALATLDPSVLDGMRVELGDDNAEQYAQLVVQEVVNEDGTVKQVVTMTYTAPEADQTVLSQLNHNQAAAYNTIQNIVKDNPVSGKDDPLSIVAGNIAYSGDAEKVKELLDEISGSQYATMMASQIEGNLSHLRRLRTHMGNGQELTITKKGLAAYVNGYSELYDLDEDSRGQGFRRSEWGATVGVEQELSEGMCVGMALSAGRASVSPTKGARFHEDTQHLDAYHVMNAGPWRNRLSVGVGFHDHDLERTMKDMGTVKADGVSGTSFNFMDEISYLIPLTESATLRPFFVIESSLNNIDSFSETGADTLSLNGSKQNAWATDLTLGVDYAVTFTALSDAPRASFNCFAGVTASVGDTTNNLYLEFAGAPGYGFEQSSADRDRWGVNLGAGISVPVSRFTSIYANAETILRSEGSSFDAQLGVRWTF